MQHVRLVTNFGDIDLELDEQKAPVTVKNFIQYLESGHYNDTIFHRIIKDFVIQGGGFTVQMQEKPTRDPIKSEADNGLKNEAYSVAMARTSDPHSATAQFFINLASNHFLDFKSKTDKEYGYTVFGKVLDGQNVIEKIKMVKTGIRHQHQDVPISDVVIIRQAKLIPPEEAANSILSN